jgi:uncharacterized iron-regulated protein
MLRRVALLLLLGACSGTYGGGPHEPKAPTAKAPAGIAAAALPYDIVDARTGRQVDPAAFWTKVESSRAVCIGEDHTNPHHHWVQLEVMKRIAHDAPAGTRLALGMEMVQRPFQGVLDDYAAHRIDAAALQSRTGWEDRWGYDFGFYGPTIDTAVAAGAQLLALNAAKELTKKVVHHGIEGLTPDERAQLPELKLDDATHRAWFDAMMESMGGAEAHSAPAPAQPGDEGTESAPPMPADHEMPSADRIYTVQVIWDESMADGTARWLAATPNGHAVILAGNGHCHDSAIVGRIKRRGIPDVISLRPVLDTEGQVAEALVKPVNDYLIVLKLPPGTKAEN